MTTNDPVIQRAHDAAKAILGEAGHVTGIVLICEVAHDGIVVAFDDDNLPPGPLSDVLRRAAEKVEAMEP